MPDLGDITNKVKDAASKHSEKTKQGLDKAGEFAKGKFSGQSDKIDRGVEKTKGYLDGDGAEDGADPAEEGLEQTPEAERLQ
jgi:hypothetical protein